METLTEEERAEVRAMMERYGWGVPDVAEISVLSRTEASDALEGRPVYASTRRDLLGATRALARRIEERREATKGKTKPGPGRGRKGPR